MAFSNSAVVPSPVHAINNHVPGHVRWVTYADSNGKPQGQTKICKLYNGRGSACLQGGVYRIVFDSTAATPMRVATITAQTVNQRYAVALNATADAAWDWFAIEGDVNALVDGDTTDVAVGDTLKVVAATNADAFIQDTSVSTTTAVPSTDTIAIAREANTGAEALKRVYLVGEVADVD